MPGTDQWHPAVSLIIPVYNTGEYLRRCLESALRQTLQDMEVIAVDDGSDDGSPQVLDDYADRHPGHLTVVHQPNAGVSAARNRGLDLARGTYVAFLDSDDFMAEDFCERLLVLALREQAQICKGSAFTISVDDDGRLTMDRRYNQYLSVFRSRLCFTSGMFTALYRLNFLREHAIRFDEDIIFSEDTLFIYQAVLGCRCLAVDDRAVYYYCRRVGSACSGPMSSRKVHDAIRVVMNISASLIRHRDALDEPGMAYSWLCLETLLRDMSIRAADEADAALARSCVEQMQADCPCPKTIARLRQTHAILKARKSQDDDCFGSPQQLVLRR